MRWGLGINGIGRKNGLRIELFIIVGLPSPSGRTPKAADGGGLQRSQTLGQRIMENIFLRNLTSKSKGRVSDASQPSSPVTVYAFLW